MARLFLRFIEKCVTYSFAPRTLGSRDLGTLMRPDRGLAFSHYPIAGQLDPLYRRARNICLLLRDRFCGK